MPRLVGLQQPPHLMIHISQHPSHRRFLMSPVDTYTSPMLASFLKVSYRPVAEEVTIDIAMYCQQDGRFASASRQEFRAIKAMATPQLAGWRRADIEQL